MMTNDFGIYVHWPYCQAKCPYCDFNSHVRAEREETRWAAAIARELKSVAEMQHASRPEVASIFFGGGTPSLMGGRAVAHVLDAIAALWPVAKDVEITLEANPNSAEQGRFRDYRAAGVNRLSVGVQALDDESLKALGRLHDAAEARRAVDLATRLFPRASLDLIYARPGQALAQWNEELNAALSLGTGHVSLYQLTIEPNTPFAVLARQGKLDVPGEILASDFYEATQELCEARGLPAYEISNHARPGEECRHNLIYWRYGEYAGVGPGAHGRLSIDGIRVATQAERLPERWFALTENTGAGFAREAIQAREAAREHLLMSLRLSEGIDLAFYRMRWGMAPDDARMRDLETQGLLRNGDGRLRATARGRLVLNRLIEELAP
ncbi:MAG: radical SAM family heme chaperone HemW [Alphaproteobacteria bacterium]